MRKKLGSSLYVAKERGVGWGGRGWEGENRKTPHLPTTTTLPRGRKRKKEEEKVRCGKEAFSVRQLKISKQLCQHRVRVAFTLNVGLQIIKIKIMNSHDGIKVPTRYPYKLSSSSSSSPSSPSPSSSSPSSPSPSSPSPSS